MSSSFASPTLSSSVVQLWQPTFSSNQCSVGRRRRRQHSLPELLAVRQMSGKATPSRVGPLTVRGVPLNLLASRSAWYVQDSRLAQRTNKTNGKTPETTTKDSTLCPSPRTFPPSFFSFFVVFVSFQYTLVQEFKTASKYDTGRGSQHSRFVVTHV